jgi:hypothetical protein
MQVAMRRLVAQSLVLLLLTLGCGGGGSGPEEGVPPEAAAMYSTLTTGMAAHMPRVPRFEGSLVGMLNPGSLLAQGVTLTPDASGPPFSYTLSGTYDGNEDGIRETTLTGKVTFNGDPNVEWSGLTGQVALDVTIPVVGHVYHADVTLSITSAERRLSGSGRFTNPMTGNTTTMTVAAATPLVIKPATGAADAMSNACGFSQEGQMVLDVAGSAGTLKSTWHFSPSSVSVAARSRTFTNPSGQTSALADTTVDAPCDGGGSLNDWVGTFDQQWACLPRESG